MVTKPAARLSEGTQKRASKPSPHQLTKVQYIALQFIPKPLKSWCRADLSTDVAPEIPGKQYRMALGDNHLGVIESKGGDANASTEREQPEVKRSS
jgi:hypothetical protein